MPKINSLLKTLLFLLLLAYGYRGHAALPDSLQKDYDHALEVLRSDLSNVEVVDSIWFHMTWDWMELEEEEYQIGIELAENRVTTASNLEEKAVMFHLLQQMYKERQHLGKAVVQYGKMIATHTLMQDTMQVIRDYHWLAWMYHENKLFEESLIAYNSVMKFAERIRD